MYLLRVVGRRVSIFCVEYEGTSIGVCMVEFSGNVEIFLAMAGSVDQYSTVE